MIATMRFKTIFYTMIQQIVSAQSGKSGGFIVLRGSGGSSGKALSYGLDGPGSIPGVGGGWDFSSLLRVQTGPGVHSASYKMSTVGFPGDKDGRA